MLGQRLRRRVRGRSTPISARSSSGPERLADAPSLTQRIFVAVRESANGLQDVWGPGRARMPGYREALIDRPSASTPPSRPSTSAGGGARPPSGRSTCSTASTTSARTSLHAGRSQGRPLRRQRPARPRPVTPREFHELAIQMAEVLSRAAARSPARRRPKRRRPRRQSRRFVGAEPRPGLKAGGRPCAIPPSPGDPRAGLGTLASRARVQ